MNAISQPQQRNPTPTIKISLIEPNTTPKDTSGANPYIQIYNSSKSKKLLENVKTYGAKPVLNEKLVDTDMNVDNSRL